MFIALKVILALVAIPAVLGLYIDRTRRAVGTKMQRYAIKNPYSLFLVILIIPGIALETLSYSRAGPMKKTPLTFFGLDRYQKEVDSDPNRSRLTTWDVERKSLCRKFEHPVYAWQREDYRETINTLLQLHNASDPYGKFTRIESYVVLNDLGVSYYEYQRNKEFKASTYLHQAMLRVATSDPDYQIVEQNLRALDEMVNSLD